MALFSELTTKKEIRLVNYITCQVLGRNELWINAGFCKVTKEVLGYPRSCKIELANLLLRSSFLIIQ